MSNFVRRKIASSLSFPNFPGTAALKHFADNVSGALLATANRLHIPRINTVISPTTHYESGDHHYVGGKTWNVLAGPRGKNKKLAFLLAQEKGYQLEKFLKTGVGHHEGPANALVPYVKPVRTLTVRKASADSTKKTK